jgi:murein DD-endopeptidase MepM/ murein hydrolase activator NlpD
LEREYFHIFILGRKTSKVRRLKVSTKTFRIAFYLLGFVFLSTTFFFCDYIQIKKKGFEISQLRHEAHIQNSQIHFFSGQIETLEKQLSNLKGFDRRIRIIANLEKGQENSPMGGVGGPSPSDIREKLKSEKDEKGLIQQMRTDIERLQSEATYRERSLSELERLLGTKKEMLTHTPSIWPVAGWLTSVFGFRMNPFTELNQMHEGIDISTPIGTLVIAPADGIISASGTDLAFGKMLVISHGFGMTSRYAHLNNILVRIGQKVNRGEKIAEVGMSGRTTGPHLHYELRLNGIPVNPMRYIMN